MVAELKLFDVTIPYWADGCDLRVKNIRAVSGDDAKIVVVHWVNRYAGYHYCDQLPSGTKVSGPRPLAEIE